MVREAEYGTSRDFINPLSLFNESAHAQQELNQFRKSPVYRGVGVPKGDGRDIFLQAGTAGNHQNLEEAEKWLKRLGYQSHNKDYFPNMATVADFWRAEQLFLSVSRQTKRPVTVIGPSMGGVFMRMLAFKHPDKINHVIGLGAPIGKDPYGKPHFYVQTLVNAARIMEIALCGATKIPQDLSSPLPDGIESDWIYTPFDKVVNPEHCLDPNPGARNRWVRGSHAGLMVNAEAMRHIAGDILPNAA